MTNRKSNKKKDKSITNNILLEIGVEPLPANFVYSAIKQLKDNAKRILESNDIIYEEIESFDTYRRLVIFVKNVEELQKSSEVEIRGPSKEIAFDENDKPTKAFFGFLKKTGLKQIDINIKKTDHGEYLYGIKREKAKKVKEILPRVLKEIIDSINCPKNMHWNKRYEFIRPIRWILALWQDGVIKLEVAGIKSNDVTYGHQILYPKSIKIKKASDYFKILKRHYVLLDFNKRRKVIEEQLKKLAKKHKGYLFEDRDLLDEITNLVEFPAFIAAKFDKKFLSLPSEVLMTSLKRGQKIFSVQDKNNKVLPVFLAVIDNNPTSEAKKKICLNYKKVLEAKLQDSEFFLKQDTKSPLVDKVNHLNEIIFQKDLGNVLEKVERVRELSKYISKILKLTQDKKDKIDRCALLSKADLTTHMVQEFPGLQGVVGYNYALISKEDKSVAEGILEHYLPKSADDGLPKSIIGSVVAIADKLDTLVSCFSIDLIPTGSYDPYALRRNALGIVRIILEKKISLSIDELIDINLELLSTIKSDLNRDKIKREIKKFLQQRLKQIILQEKAETGLIEAVLSANCDDFRDVSERLEQLDRISKSKKFFETCKVVERTNNILKKIPNELPKVNSKLFKETLEEKLYQLYNGIQKNINELIDRKEYKIATELYADTFFQPIHVFFDKILVNVDNEKIRNNRLSLMKDINRLYTEKIADLSKINF